MSFPADESKRQPEAAGERASAYFTGDELVRLLSSALEHSTSLVLIADLEGRIAFVNPKFTQTTDYTAEEAIGRHITSLGGEIPEGPEAVWQAIQQQGSWSGEVRNWSKSGQEYWLQVHISPIKDRAGEITHFLGVAENITERKLAEQGLRESEERYRALYEDNPSMYFTVDEAGTVRSVNRYGAQQLGYRPDELVGRPVLDVFHEDDKGAVRRQLAAVIAKPGETAMWEFRKVRKDGIVLWVREAAQAVRDPYGETITLIVCEDISERKQAEEALRESEQRYRALVEATPDMMFRLSREGVYLDFIPAKGLEPFVPPEEFLGRNILEVLPADTAGELRAALTQALETGELQTIEYELPMSSDVRHYEGRVVVSGEDEVLAIVRDITESRKTQEVLEQFRETLEERVERRLEEKSPYGLTFRELTVLQLVASGRPDREIGSILGIAPRTANKHVENILSKMGAASRTEAGVRAVREGLVD